MAGSPGILGFLRQRLRNRTDNEHGQAITRIVLVSIIFAYFYTDYFAAKLTVEDLLRIQRIGLASLMASYAIFTAILVNPAASVIRRLVGMFHDVIAISLAVYLGEGAGAVVAVIYLWITIGNGFRYGVAYLYGCAACCISGFGLVYASSDYWQGQNLLSINIVLSMLIISPFVGSLLRKLNAARDALQQQASTDSLTGLLNRAEMEKAVAALFEGDHSGHVLLFFDLDRFKEVNDVAGHAAGDKLLTDIGEIVRASVRRDDLCGRMGGDEFCVLLRDCSVDRGRAIAEEIRSKMTGYRLAWGTEYFSVGVSIGVAPASATSDSESLFRLADAACYAAKNAGRNRVHVVDPRVDSLDTQEIRTLFHTGRDAPRGGRSGLVRT